MAKANIRTDEAGQAVHTRTTSDSVETQAMVVAIDGSDSVVPADATFGLAGDVRRSVLPTGAATSANQSTIIGHLDGVEAGLAGIETDTADLAPIRTAIERVAAAVATEVQVDIVAALPSGSNAIGTVSARPIPVTSGGLLVYRNPDLDEVDQQVKASAGQLYGWFVSNTSTVDDIYVHFYAATTASVTVGTTTPAWSLHLGPREKANVLSAMGIAFATAITVAATKDVAGRTAPDTGQCVCNLFYF